MTDHKDQPPALPTDTTTGELEKLAVAIGGVVGQILNPIAQAQTEAQVEAIRAQDRQHERNTAAWLQEGRRAFVFSMTALIMAGGLVGALALTSKPDAALYALTYFGGVFSGFAYGRLKNTGALK